MLITVEIINEGGIMIDRSEYLKNIAIGDKLWSFELGGCVVTTINPKLKHGISVINKDEKREVYTFSGKLYEHSINPSLLFVKPKFQDECFIKPKPDLQAGDVLEVWNEQDNTFRLRRFAEWDPVKGVRVSMEGSRIGIMSYSYYRIIRQFKEKGDKQR